MSDLIVAPKALAAYQINFEFPLLDLNRTPVEQITGGAILRSSLRLLKYSRSSELLEHLHDILSGLGQSLLSDQQEDWIAAMGVYIMAVNKSIDEQQYKQTVASVFPTQFEPGSLADRLLIRGRNEGRAEGREQGRDEGRVEGREQGRVALIETIRMLEELLGISVTATEMLSTQALDSLTAIIAQLQQQLRDRRT